MRDVGVMEQQAVYMPGYSAGAAQPFRGVPGPSLTTPPGPPPPVSMAPPQGSKLATYMNRRAPGPQPQGYQDVSNKMSNLSLINRPAAPGKDTSTAKKLSCHQTVFLSLCRFKLRRTKSVIHQASRTRIPGRSGASLSINEEYFR